MPTGAGQPRLVGRFNAAGSSRSLRRTATRAGVGQTATVSELSEARQSLVARLDDPDPGELRSWIDAGRCWWCRDERIFKSLSGHWVKAHDINVQGVRDLLGVRKRSSFVSDETREKMAANGRKNYDPTKLRVKPGVRRHLSTFGREAQRKKSQQRIAKLPPRKIIHCAICGAIIPWRFYNGKTGGSHPKSCSNPACRFEVRSRASKGRKAPWAKPPHKPPKTAPCVVCGVTVIRPYNRKTCSDECKQKRLKAVARSRDHTSMIEAAAKWRAAQPVRTCDEEGCDRKHRVHGMCSMHYQRVEAAKRKAAARP